MDCQHRSKSICSKDTLVLDQTTIAVGATIAILLILLVASVTILIFKKLKQKRRESQMKTEGNAVYGQYYSDDGERIDQGRVYAEDRNPNYY